MLPEPAALTGALASPGAARYRPDPCGAAEARAAVASYYADHGVSVDPEHIVLTASTSEAYGFVFRLVCNPGDRVLVPQPSYPLFAFLAGLDSVDIEGITMTERAVRRGLESGAAGLVLVNPNNPTGHWVGEPFRSQALELCSRHGAPLIVDEVFLDYPADCPADYPTDSSTDSSSGAPASRCRSLAGSDGALVFTLSGLSKVCGLPGFKLGWMVVSGRHRAEALRRLEVIADTYLSVGSPVQAALPGLLAGRHAFQARVRERLSACRAIVRGWPTARPGAGWSAVLPLPEGIDDGQLAIELAERGVIVHPGYFFDCTQPALVVSLLSPPEWMARGLDVISDRLS